MSSYKLILKDSQVYAVREEDLPKREDFVSSPSGWESYDMKAYQAALSEAIERKGLSVVNMERVGNHYGEMLIEIHPGELSDLPEGYEVKIKEQTVVLEGGEETEREVARIVVARIVPVAKQEPKRNPKLEAIRERTPQEVKDRVDEMMKQMKQEPDPEELLWTEVYAEITARDNNEDGLREAFKVIESKYTIQRRMCNGTNKE